MKRILIFLVFCLLLSGVYTSCKKDQLAAMRNNEVQALDKYVKNHNLAAYKDPSGIYFKNEIIGTGDTIKSGNKVMLQYNIFTIDSVKVFSTEDQDGHTYEEDPFYVDVSNAAVNAKYIQQIAGMHIGMKKMRIGGRAFMVIPSELAFKAVDHSINLHIPRFSTLLVYVYAKKGYATNTY